MTASALPSARLIDSILDELRDQPKTLSEAEDALTAMLTKRGIHFGEGLLPTYPIPFFAPAEAHDQWVAQSELLAQAIEDIANDALGDPSMMRALHLREDARAWVEIDPGFARISVLARPDAIFVDKAVRYVEYNSDSPAMMAFSDHVSECLMDLPHLQKYKQRLRTECMLPRLLDTLLACYREYGGASTTPTIAIVDWPGQKTRFEHARIAEHFEARGCSTIVCDPRSLSRPGRKLEHEGRAIDIVYRRALFTELLERRTEVEPLISAYRDGAVCMVNPLRSYLASSKTLLAFLCSHWPYKDKVCPVIPTRILSASRIEALRQKDESVVLKKGESHGGLHVLLPGLTTAEERLSALDEAMQSPWVDQDFAPLPKLRIPTRKDAGSMKYYNWNPFLFDGRYAGGIARASDTPLINITLGGGLLPTLRVES